MYGDPFGGARHYYNPMYYQSYQSNPAPISVNEYLELKFWYNCSTILLNIANTFIDYDCRAKLINVMSELIITNLPYKENSDLIGCYINSELADYLQRRRIDSYDCYEFDEIRRRMGNIIVYYNDEIIYSSKTDKWFSGALSDAYRKDWCGHDIYDKETFEDAKKQPRPQLKDIEYNVTDVAVEFKIYTE